MPRFPLSLVLTMVCALPLSAQLPASHSSTSFLDPQAGTTESELVTRALAQNPTLTAVRKEIEMPRGSLTQARLRKNPPLTAGWFHESDSQENRGRIGWALPLELFGRRHRATPVP